MKAFVLIAFVGALGTAVVADPKGYDHHDLAPVGPETVYTIPVKAPEVKCGHAFLFSCKTDHAAVPCKACVPKEAPAHAPAKAPAHEPLKDYRTGQPAEIMVGGKKHKKHHHGGGGHHFHHHHHHHHHHGHHHGGHHGHHHGGHHGHHHGHHGHQHGGFHHHH